METRQPLVAIIYAVGFSPLAHFPFPPNENGATKYTLQKKKRRSRKN